MAIGYYTRSITVLSSLYGLLFGFITLVFYIVSVVSEASATVSVISFGLVALISLGFLFIQFLISPWLMDLQLRWIYDMNWVHLDELPESMANAIQKTMDAYQFSIGKIGIIHDGMPNAFTYGRFRGGARLVFTEGIIDLLDSDEQVAVVQHEMGHVVNYDFLFMTLASAIPLLFYYFYRTSVNLAKRLSESSKGRSSNGKNGANPAPLIYLIAVMAYVVYFISQYIVLLLSRYREHSADMFSAHSTQQPGKLSSALVKIAYGLVTRETEIENEIRSKETSADRRRNLDRQRGYSNAMSSMGLADVNMSKGLVMQAAAGNGEVNAETVAAAATWDLKTPWAKFIELSSTHPLTGKRLKALDDEAENMGLERKYPDLGKIRPPESLWDEFFIDLFVMAIVPWLVVLLPLIGYAVGVFTSYDPLASIGAGFILGSIFWFVRISIKYPANIEQYTDINKEPNTVVEALSSMKMDGYYEASPIRGKSIIIEGEVGGRGIPGYIVSEDFMVRDNTGFIVVDYSSIVPFYNLWFGWRHVKKLMGQRVRVVGWYHRGIMPKIQLHRLILLDEDNKVRKNRWRGVNKMFAIILMGIGTFFVFNLMIYLP